MKRTLPHSKKRRALRVFLGALFSMIAGGLGAGLLRTRSALSGIDVSTLLFYYDSLMSEFTDHRVTSMAEVFSSYSVITEVASASIRLAVIAGILFLLAYISLSFSRARVTLSVAVRWKTLRLPLTFPGGRPLYVMLAAGALLLSAIISIVCTVHLPRYLYLQSRESTIYEDLYVDPDTVGLRFPEKKQNLIHIYLESMETTYEDTASGGQWDTNLIPQLTQLSEENVSFSTVVSLTGADYTSGALVAQTAGIPINRKVGKYSHDGEFLPYAASTESILAQAGYRNLFMCGSDAAYGARALYFITHGDTEIWDYNTAVDAGMIEADYASQTGSWGLKDYDLFDAAKSVLTEMAEGNQPFSFSILTVDTHFYDGRLCEYCGNGFPTQYENVIHCSDALVAQFVEWIQAQPFYENTTIVITGDHPTMDLSFIATHTDSLSARGIYTCIINPRDGLAPASRETRQASSFDIFPTTLAALGVQWDGDQLAFGVNLFSGAPTLVEQLGREAFDLQLQMPSDTYLKKFYHL